MIDPSIDCKQFDCPYYGLYEGKTEKEAYSKKLEIMVLSDEYKNEIDMKIRATCHACIYFPQERLDMKKYVEKETAKRLLNK